MYLHECYVVPKAALIAVVEYLRKRPFDEVAGLLDGLDGSPEGTSGQLVAAKIGVHPDDVPAWRGMSYCANLALWLPDPERNGAHLLKGAETGTVPLPGETAVDFPAGVGRRE